MISAKVIAHSVGPQGPPVCTMQVTCHRFILAELNTHRVFSRNYRSSRAVPVKKLLEEVRTAPALPVTWQANKSGMSGGVELEGRMLQLCKDEWMEAAAHAADHAEYLDSFGLHKSWVNRVIEPYLFVHGIITSTEWSNFYRLRRAADAQPEIKMLADAMYEAQKASVPTILQHGEWHLPFIYEPTPNALKVSAARCARVSYKLHDGTNATVEADLKLADSLIKSGHWSPFEHQATPDEALVGNTNSGKALWKKPYLHGNFDGWVQFRQTVSINDN